MDKGISGFATKQSSDINPMKIGLSATSNFSAISGVNSILKNKAASKLFPDTEAIRM